MDRELRPKMTAHSFGAGLLAVLLTALLFLFLAALVSGCAALNGQERIGYTGHVTFKSVVRPPEPIKSLGMASGARVPSYWDRRTYGVFTIENGTNLPIHLELDCGLYEPTVDVPPLTSQKVLIETTAKMMDRDLCAARNPLPY